MALVRSAIEEYLHASLLHESEGLHAGEERERVPGSAPSGSVAWVQAVH